MKKISHEKFYEYSNAMDRKLHRILLPSLLVYYRNDIKTIKPLDLLQVIYIGSLFLNKVFHSFLKSTRFHFHFKFFNLRIWTLKCNNFHLKGAKGTQNLRYHYSLSDSECKIIFDNKYLSKIWGKFFFLE